MAGLFNRFVCFVALLVFVYASKCTCEHFSFHKFPRPGWYPDHCTGVGDLQRAVAVQTPSVVGNCTVYKRRLPCGCDYYPASNVRGCWSVLMKWWNWQWRSEWMMKWQTWLGGLVVRTSDSRLQGRGFASRSWHCLVIYFWDRWPSLAGILS